MSHRYSVSATYKHHATNVEDLWVRLAHVRNIEVRIFKTNVDVNPIKAVLLLFLEHDKGLLLSLYVLLDSAMMPTRRDVFVAIAAGTAFASSCGEHPG